MQSKEILLIDIDETSAETIRDGVYPLVNKKYGTNFRHETTFDYRDVFGNLIQENGELVTLQRKIEIFNGAILEDKGKNLIKPVAGSVEKISAFSDGYNVGMLTARHPMLADYTPEWVAHHYNGTVSQVLFSNCYHGGKRTKPEICKEVGAKIMIEDDLDYALQLAREKVFVLLLRKPWNERRKETHRNIKRHDTWDDIKL